MTIYDIQGSMGGVRKGNTKFRLIGETEHIKIYEIKFHHSLYIITRNENKPWSASWMVQITCTPDSGGGRGPPKSFTVVMSSCYCIVFPLEGDKES